MWSLYENEKKLEPLIFSNGKNQGDIVNEIIGEVKKGTKLIFIKGVCGTGKSAIALNLAKEIGKASIIVPIKNLQKQYEEDYTERKYLFKNNGEKLRIKIITGRQNFLCPFIKRNKIMGVKEDTTLDNFGFKNSKNKTNKRVRDSSCNNSFLPCKIEIKERNEEIIKEYLRKNPKIKGNLTLKDVRRMSIAPICPYWSPVMPAELDLNLDDAKQTIYKGLKNRFFIVHKRKRGCGYYDQYDSYVDSDILIFNSHKYLLETVMNRKPSTDIEIIDECDKFLDDFSESMNINLNRLYFALGGLFSDNERINEAIKRVTKITKQLLNSNFYEDEILPVKKSLVAEIFYEFLDNDIMSYVECDEENYCYHVEEVGKTFQEFLDETFISFSKEERGVTAKIVTTNLKERFRELQEKNKVLVLMSGTIHSDEVLRDIFGVKDYKVIEAETKMPGKISFLQTGKEINCRYENFKSGKITRQEYLLALDKCLKQAVKPTLVHVISFLDLPTEKEVSEYGLEILSQEKLIETQNKEKVGENLKKFKNKEIPILYSTKCNRGVDFPGDVCNSIILTKYPYPDVKALFWKILRRTHPGKYSNFYLDKAWREFLQRIYRGLRSKDDHIFLLSPDTRVFQHAEKLIG